MITTATTITLKYHRLLMFQKNYILVALNNTINCKTLCLPSSLSMKKSLDVWDLGMVSNNWYELLLEGGKNVYELQWPSTETFSERLLLHI